MNELFLRLLRNGVSAGWLVLLIAVLRLVLRRWPRWVFPLLWSLVGVRLLLPVRLFSRFSLVPQLSAVPSTAVAEPYAVRAGVDLLSVGSLIWAVGATSLLLYGLISYLLLRCRLRTAVLQGSRIYRSEYARSPFILGIITPRIYLPFHLSEADAAHVIAHEEAHIRRRDHWIKPAAFVLLAVYWFHPLLWLAFILLCRDIELACDERVVREMTEAQRAAYAQTLLTCTANRTLVPACPLSFGSGAIGERVRSVLAYKRATRLITLAAMALLLVLAFGFLTDPVTPNHQAANGSEQRQGSTDHASLLHDSILRDSEAEAEVSSMQNTAEHVSGAPHKEKPISVVPSEPQDDISAQVMFRVADDGTIVMDEGHSDFEVSVSQVDDNTTEYLIKPIFP